MTAPIASLHLGKIRVTGPSGEDVCQALTRNLPRLTRAGDEGQG
jgi:hypothetical protein